LASGHLQAQKLHVLYLHLALAPDLEEGQAGRDRLHQPLSWRTPSALGAQRQVLIFHKSYGHCLRDTQLDPKSQRQAEPRALATTAGST
ncbi:hypothetical protein P7K49_026583, partial [Saguinus oedipus]